MTTFFAYLCRLVNNTYIYHVFFYCCRFFAGSHYGAHSPSEAKSGYPYIGSMEMYGGRVH